MKQLTKNNKTGKLAIDEVSSPVLEKGHVIVQNIFSAVSVGTEKATIEIAKKTLLEKARSRPDDLKKVLKLMKSEGIFSAYTKSMNKLKLPSPIGYSSVGKVIEVADDIKNISVGDTVACGGMGHAEIISVPRNLCAKVPSSVKKEHAAFTTIASIAMQGVRQADAKIGESIGVIGLGLIGQITLKILEASGCDPVGLDIDKNSISHAEKSGFVCFNSNDKSLSSKIKNITEGNGFDKIIICAATKSNDPLEMSVDLVRDRGNITVVGVVRMDIPRKPFYNKELSINISRSYGPGRYDNNYEIKGRDYPISYVRWTENRNFKSILSLLEKGKLNFDDIISEKTDFSNATNVYDKLLKGSKAFGVLFEYDKNPLKSTIVEISKDYKIIDKNLINVGFIGAGNYAQNMLLPAIKKISSVNLHTVSTNNGLNSNHLANKYDFKFASTGFEEVINNKDIDCVFVVTRHNSHANIVEAALNKDKHVFVEKPLAIDKKQLQNIKSSWSSSKGSLTVGFNRRYSPLISQAIERLDSGLNIAINYRINSGRLNSNHWIHDLEVGGGRIIGELCHFVDLASFICKSRIKEVSSFSMPNNNQKINYNDTISLIIKYENDSIANISYFSNGDSSLEKERLEIFNQNSTAVISDFKSMDVYSQGSNKTINLRRQDKGQMVMLEKFFLGVKKGKPLMNFEELYEVSDLMLRL